MVLNAREWLILAGLVILDQLSKGIVLVTRPANGIFEMTWNTGAGFGILQNRNEWLLALAIIVLVIIILSIKHAQTHERIALIVLSAGIIGNVIDRVVHGAVLDFISVGTFPVFNIADSLITLSILYLLAKVVRESYASWQYKRMGANEETPRRSAARKKK